MVWLKTVDKLKTRGVSHAGAGIPRPRSYGVHNKGTPKISAACAKGKHYDCCSLNCTCDKCGHPKPNG
jgi:hypothetical protein